MQNFQQQNFLYKICATPRTEVIIYAMNVTEDSSIVKIDPFFKALIKICLSFFGFLLKAIYFFCHINANVRQALIKCLKPIILYNFKPEKPKFRREEKEETLFNSSK
ncbi:hypothetical protein BpHYR1_034579 [Brachionus plicatilis]|uniref:Uncharacterized protein n=1 Tax=Brachionus plicatilis TaxID=10195 RepID=A0A3M7R868_BRAPC|nr:hypothetical protein BpHYR1_034579 [Brachionus plicatilis]